MRFANISKLLLLLSAPAILVAGVSAQRPIDPARVREQLNQVPGAAQPKPAAATPAPAKPAAAKSTSAKPVPAAAAVKPAAAKVPAAAPAKGPAKESAKPVSKSAVAAKDAKPAEKPAEEKVSGPRRDPFDSLLTRARPGNGAPENLPPGKAGLMVSTLRIDGIVGGKVGMIAIVSNPQQRVYFVREGDKLYDGNIEKISLDMVSFREFGKDAFGKPTERQVIKRLYPSPGEQQ